MLIYATCVLLFPGIFMQVEMGKDRRWVFGTNTGCGSWGKTRSLRIKKVRVSFLHKMWLLSGLKGEGCFKGKRGGCVCVWVSDCPSCNRVWVGSFAWFNNCQPALFLHSAPVSQPLQLPHIRTFCHKELFSILPQTPGGVLGTTLKLADVALSLLDIAWVGTISFVVFQGRLLSLHPFSKNHHEVL